jgi:hypothetical protein
LVPGYAESHHLKAGEFVLSLCHAFKPLNETQQSAVLQTFQPLFSQLGITSVPKDFKGLAAKLGFGRELNRKLTRVDYCTDHENCGFMQLVPMVDRTMADAPLCEVCDKQIYIKAPGKDKYQPIWCDYIVDPYESVLDLLNRKEFFDLYEEQWPLVSQAIANPDAVPTNALGLPVYNDWLNGQARRFFRWVRDKVDGNFLRYDPKDKGTVVIFVMDIADYMSSATNIQSTRGAKSFGGFVTKLLSLPGSVRNLSDWTFSDQVYNDGKKVKNPLQRQEWRLRSAREWRIGRLLTLEDGRVLRVHIVHMWWQGDGPMLEEFAGRMNYQNPNWWWQHCLVFIDVQDIDAKKNTRHVVYPFLLNLKALQNTAQEIDQQAIAVTAAYKVSAAAGKAAARAHGVNFQCAFAGGLAESRRLEALEYFQFDYFFMQGWDHIHAGLIKDLMKLVMAGMPAAAKDLVTETIEQTQTARGEPTLCNWVVDGHNKIHSLLNWFLHDAMFHLWRILTDDELVMVTMLWTHLVHIRLGSPTEHDLEISALARTNYELMRELRYGVPTSKPNNVKNRRVEFSVREFMTLPSSSELVVDAAMKDIMLSLRKLMANGGAMKGAMKRFVFDKMMVQLRWLTAGPIDIREVATAFIPCSNPCLRLLGNLSNDCTGGTVCFDKPQLLAAALAQFEGISVDVAGPLSLGLQSCPVSTWKRMATAYSHPGRTFCTAKHDKVRGCATIFCLLRITHMHGTYLPASPVQAGCLAGAVPAAANREATSCCTPPVRKQNWSTSPISSASHP